MRSVVICVLLTLGSASCAPVYVPLAPTLPLVVDQGELNISASMSGAVLGNLNAAYGIVDNLAIFVETGIEPGDPQGTDRDRNFYQLLGGIGYGNRIDNFWRFDVYAGGGLGRGESIGDWGLFGSDMRHMRARFTNYFVQFDIGYVDDEVETGYQLRAINASFDPFHHIDAQFGLEGNLVSNAVTEGPSNTFFLEHSFVAKRGSEKL